MTKPRVKCERITFELIQELSFLAHPDELSQEFCFVAYLDRLSDHPNLGPPRCESRTRTSLILRIDFERREFETQNTIYWWEAGRA